MDGGKWANPTIPGFVRLNKVVGTLLTLSSTLAIQYGNEPDAMNTYSSCAIIAEISPRASQEAETDGTASGAEDVDEAESSAVLEESRVDLTTATQ